MLSSSVRQSFSASVLLVLTVGQAAVFGLTPCSGEDDCCTLAAPCGKGVGDCDANDDCAEDLVCGTNNCDMSSGIYDSTDDCCQAACNGGDSCCRSSAQCAVGEGDCDSDTDCAGRLVCGEDNCDQSRDIFDLSDDCCEKPGEFSN
jgi:hypothetical protein